MTSSPSDPESPAPRRRSAARQQVTRTTPARVGRARSAATTRLAGATSGEVD
jgi:hypothetical protein